MVLSPLDLIQCAFLPELCIDSDEANGLQASKVMEQAILPIVATHSILKDNMRLPVSQPAKRWHTKDTNNES